MMNISRGKKYFIVYIVTVITVVVVNYLIGDIHIKNTTKAFHNNKYLWCFRKSNEPTYMINQKDGWSIINQTYFTKDTILVDMRDCKEQ